MTALVFDLQASRFMDLAYFEAPQIRIYLMDFDETWFSDIVIVDQQVLIDFTPVLIGVCCWIMMPNDIIIY